MNIPPFSLPSNPIKKIAMREATVLDALDFCDIDPDMEEALTTLFLDRVQLPGDGFFGSKLWTADDRRLGLYWYWLHTVSDTEARFSYDCGHCDKTHEIRYDMRKLADGYKSISRKAVREFEFNGEAITIRPLTGADMEALELMRRAILPGMAKKDAIKLHSTIRLAALMRVLWFSSVGIDEDRLIANEKKILSMSMTDLKSLTDIVAEKNAEMEHGLESVIDNDNGRILLIIQTKCDVVGSDTLLRVPFRDFVNIPVV
jgi:hypothetical protein